MVMKINSRDGECTSKLGYELQCRITDRSSFSNYYLVGFMEGGYFVRWLNVAGVNR